MSQDLPSCIYDCEVVHVRITPKKHRFSYRLFFLDLDLDEVPQLARRLWLFSQNKFNFYTFRDRDHLNLGLPTLRENLTTWIQEQGVILPAGCQIRLLTLPRILGYIFNPVSFYVIRDQEGEPLHVVVEVCNTFRELKPWLIANAERPGFFRIQVPKYFYVSPFSSLTTEFEFRVQVPDSTLAIHINDYEKGQRTLSSWIHGERREMTNLRLLFYSIRFPLLTWQVIVKIHWQALLLWMKGVQFFQKTADPDLQRDLHRPRPPIQKLPRP